MTKTNPSYFHPEVQVERERERERDVELTRPNDIEVNVTPKFHDTITFVMTQWETQR